MNRNMSVFSHRPRAHALPCAHTCMRARLFILLKKLFRRYLTGLGHLAIIGSSGASYAPDIKGRIKMTKTECMVTLLQRTTVMNHVVERACEVSPEFAEFSAHVDASVRVKQQTGVYLFVFDDLPTNVWYYGYDGVDMYFGVHDDVNCSYTRSQNNLSIGGNLNWNYEPVTYKTEREFCKAYRHNSNPLASGQLRGTKMQFRGTKLYYGEWLLAETLGTLSGRGITYCDPFSYDYDGVEPRERAIIIDINEDGHSRKQIEQQMRVNSMFGAHMTVKVKFQSDEECPCYTEMNYAVQERVHNALRAYENAKENVRQCADDDPNMPKLLRILERSKDNYYEQNRQHWLLEDLNCSQY